MTNRSLLLAALVTTFFTSMAHAVPLTGLELWLKADAGVTTSGSNVTAWADQTGGTVYNLTQATSTKQPTFVSNWRNGKPAIQFDGVDDYLTDQISNLDLTSGLSIFVVAQNDVRKDYNGNFKLSFAGQPESTNSYLETYWQAGVTNATSGSAVYTVNRAGGGPFGVLLVGNDPPAVTKPYVFEVTAGGSLSQMLLNEQLRASNPSALLPTSSAGYPVVGFGYSSQSLQGYIAEVLIYNRAVTSVERKQIWEELAFAYDVPEPTSLASLAGLGGVLALRRRRRQV